MKLSDVFSSDSAALTVTEVAELLRVDPRTISRACDAGDLPCIRLGARRLIPRLRLLELLTPPTDHPQEESMSLHGQSLLK